MLSTCTRWLWKPHIWNQHQNCNSRTHRRRRPRRAQSQAFCSFQLLSLLLLQPHDWALHPIFQVSGMPKKCWKTKPEIYASFNCCSCMRFNAKAIIERSCAESPLEAGELDASEAEAATAWQFVKEKPTKQSLKACSLNHVQETFL